MQSAENPLWVCAYQTPRVPLVAELYRTDAVNVGSRIHSIEKEAYTAVLRAFIAQSDVLSWVCFTLLACLFSIEVISSCSIVCLVCLSKCECHPFYV